MSALICPLCNQEIKPGDECDFIGTRADSRARIMPVVNAEALQAVHWRCAHPNELADFEPDPS